MATEDTINSSDSGSSVDIYIYIRTLLAYDIVGLLISVDVDDKGDLLYYERSYNYI